MGIWDRVTGQLGQQWLDVVEWVDDGGDVLLYRYPIHDRAITDQSKLVVREGQQALFVAEGALSQVFGPGTYTLDTPNAPIVSFLRSIAYNFQTPYKGDVLFVSTRQFTNQGWGTQNPFMMRDAEFGPVRVRAFGTFSFRVQDAAKVLREVVGTDGRFTADEIGGQLKKRVVSAFTAAIAQSGVPVLDLAAHVMSVGERVRAQMNPEFEAAYGITLTDFTIANIGLPPEVEAALDTRTKMGVLGNLDAYARFRAADAIGTAAANPGMGGAGMGLGVGLAMGQAVAQQLGGLGAGGGSFDPQTGLKRPDVDAPPPLPTDAEPTFHYAGPGGQAQLTAAQVAERVRSAPDARHLVWRKGFDGWKPAAEVAEVAARLADLPPPLPPG